MEFTKGVWKVKESPILHIKSINGLVCEMLYTGDGTAEANAHLIADAGTTSNKCGLLPSEILEQRDELLEALQGINKHWSNGNFSRDKNLWEAMDKAINRALNK